MRRKKREKETGAEAKRKEGDPIPHLKEGQRKVLIIIMIVKETRITLKEKADQDQSQIKNPHNEIVLNQVIMVLTKEKENKRILLIITRSQ